jgi:signal transduction histidine kinase
VSPATLEPPQIAAVDFIALAGAVRRVTGSEGVVILTRAAGTDLQVEFATGLSARELPEFVPGEPEGPRAFFAERFEGVLGADLDLHGEHLGYLYALRRGAGPFDNEDLIHTFAAQVALALGAARYSELRADRHETWPSLDQLVLSAHSIDELGRTLTAVIGPHFGGARIGVMIADRQRGMLQMMPGAFGADERTVASHRVSFFDPRSNSARVFTTRLPYMSNASAGDSSIRQSYVDMFEIGRILTLPLEGVGVLHLADSDRRFDLDDLLRAQELAPRIATVVELANTLFRLRRRQRMEETLAQLALAVASGESLHDFLPPALDELCEASDANLVALVPDAAPAIIARRGEQRRDLERAVLAEAGTDPGMRAYVVGPRRAGDPGWAAFYAPVELGGARVGTLAALRVRGEPFARPERGSFVRLANVAALHHAAERYQQQRAQLARLHERQRIADDLHDDVAQILFAAQLSLDSILQVGGVDEGTAAEIARARSLLIRGDTAIRTVIHRLSRPPATDLGARLASVVSGVESEFSIAIHMDVRPDTKAAARYLRRPVGEALIRAAREALVNAAKHAGPCRIAVTLQVVRNRLLLTIADDGLGRSAATSAPHHGLAALRTLIREQGGTLRLCNAGGGTKVTVSVPVGAPHRAAARGRSAPAALAAVPV